MSRKQTVPGIWKMRKYCLLEYHLGLLDTSAVHLDLELRVCLGLDYLDRTRTEVNLSSHSCSQYYPLVKTPTDRLTISGFLPCQTSNSIPTTLNTKAPKSFPSLLPSPTTPPTPLRSPSTLSIPHDHPSHATSSTWQYTNSCMICDPSPGQFSCHPSAPAI